jgi:hypothetical protein
MGLNGDGNERLHVKGEQKRHCFDTEARSYGETRLPLCYQYFLHVNLR